MNFVDVFGEFFGGSERLEAIADLAVDWARCDLVAFFGIGMDVIDLSNGGLFGCGVFVVVFENNRL